MLYSKIFSKYTLGLHKLNKVLSLFCLQQKEKTNKYFSFYFQFTISMFSDWKSLYLLTNVHKMP